MTADEQALCDRALSASLLADDRGLRDVADVIRDLHLAWLGATHGQPHAQPAGTRPRTVAREAGIQHAGTRPRTVGVGMVLCRPGDGTGAIAWQVESVGRGVSAALSDCDDYDRRLTVAIAAIVHEAGGWVLAADWVPKEGGEQ